MGAQPGRLAGAADWIVLPGSKPPAPTWPGCARRGWTAPLPRTRGRGRHRAGRVRRPADAGRGADRPRRASTATAPGLGLLPLVTVFEPAKTVQRTSAAFGQLTGAWARSRACVLRATKSTTARPPSTPPWPPRATWRARSCPASPGRTRRAMCWACTCTACSRMPPCCTPCLAPRRPRWTACSTAWPMAWPGTSTRACWTR
jgi:hypothetical protein